MAIDPQTLILCPLVDEWRLLSGAFAQRHTSEPVDDPRIDAVYFPDWRVLVAPRDILMAPKSSAETMGNLCCASGIKARPSP